MVIAINAGKLTAYDAHPLKDDPNGDSFEKPLTANAAKARLTDSVLITRRDANNNVISSAMSIEPYDANEIERFRVKQDYYFDKHHHSPPYRIRQH